LESKHQPVPIRFQPPDKLKLELQLPQSEREFWPETHWISKSFLMKMRILGASDRQPKPLLNSEVP